MKSATGFEYTVNGWEDVQKFAQGVLTLVNVQSSRKGSIFHVKTTEGTNLVTVKSFKKIDEDLERTMGKIENVEEIHIRNVEFTDLKKETQTQLQKDEEELDTEALVFFEAEFE